MTDTTDTTPEMSPLMITNLGGTTVILQEEDLGGVDPLLPEMTAETDITIEAETVIIITGGLPLATGSLPRSRRVVAG